MSRQGRSVVGTLCLAMLCTWLSLAVPAAASDLPDPTAGVGVIMRLGAIVPTDVPFLDETGRSVRLSAYLGGPPVLLVPVYYTCPNVCGGALADLAFALQRLPLQPGRDYRVVAVSIDPREGPAIAAQAKRRALATDAPRELSAATHFLTGPADSSAALMQSIGFRYRWDDRLQQYVHLSGVAVLTADGRLARWLPGIGLEPADLRLAIAEAGRGRIDGVIDRFLLLCSHYDPKTGRYTGFVDWALKAGGIAVTAALVIPILWSVVRERRRQKPSGRAV